MIEVMEKSTVVGAKMNSEGVQKHHTTELEEAGDSVLSQAGLTVAIGCSQDVPASTGRYDRSIKGGGTWVRG